MEQFPMGCIICGGDADRAHIKSRGSGGSDSPDNLLALCRHHHILQHSLGWNRFCERFPVVRAELAAKGWEVRSIFGVMKLARK